MADTIARPGRGEKRRASIQAYVGILISLLCLWWLLSSIEAEHVLDHIKNADPWLLACAFLVTFSSYVLRSFRWRFFFESGAPSFADSFRCLIVGFFMNNVLPARMGELVRAHLGGRATKHSRSVVLATIAGERLADGLMISLLFAVLFSTASGIEAPGEADEVYLVTLVFFAAALLTGAMLWYRQKVFEVLSRLGEIMPGHLSTYTLIRIKRFIVGLEPLLKGRTLFVLAVLSIIVWSIELAAYALVVSAFGQEMSLGGLALFLAAVNFSSLIPAAPGAIGVIEAFATMALVKIIGVAPATALSMVVVQHAVQYLVVGIPGLYYFFRMGGRIPKAEGDSDLDDEPAAPSFIDVSGPRPQDETEALLREGELPSGIVAGDAVEELDISIVIPAYNEENRLPKTLLTVLEYLSLRGRPFEVLVVDDGSTDDTAKVVRQFEKLSPSVKLLVYARNRGKGYAVRFGVLNARGKLILYNDADGASPIEELSRLEAAIAAGADIAIGSRAMYSRETHVDTVWYRKLMGRVFNGFVNVILLPGIADTQCGFKMFRKDVAKSIFRRQREERFSFDVEVLFLARRAGYRIAEVPINWHNVPGSKVNLVNDSLAMFLDLVKIRARYVFGGYQHPSGALTKPDAAQHVVSTNGNGSRPSSEPAARSNAEDTEAAETQREE